MSARYVSRNLNLMAEADSAEIMSDESRLHLAALLETGRRELRKSKACVAAVLEEVDRHA